jgi:hypothetical protein
VEILKNNKYMDILLKGLTEIQSQVLAEYFKENLNNDSSFWIQEYCKDTMGIEVFNITQEEDLIEIHLISYDYV